MRWSSRMGLLAAMALATTGCNLTWVAGVVPGKAPGRSAKEAAPASNAGTCELNRMGLSTGAWNGGAGVLISAVRFTNSRPTTCTLRGAPAVELSTGRGARIATADRTIVDINADSPRWPGYPLVTLPGFPSTLDVGILRPADDP